MAAIETHAVPKLTLYTNHVSPWCHRVHIALAVVDLPYEEIIVPLGRGDPNKEWYLKEVNPRGFVPALKVQTADGKKHIITESAIIVGFVIDLASSLQAPYSSVAAGLSPLPTSVENSLQHASQSFFIDTTVAKLILPMFGMLGVHQKNPGVAGAGQATPSDAAAILQDVVGVIKSELDPLLSDAAPYYGGAKSITIVEVMVGAFILGLYSFIDGGVLPKSVGGMIAQACPSFDRWARAVQANEFVSDKRFWDAEAVIEKQRKRMEKIKIAEV